MCTTAQLRAKVYKEVFIFYRPQLIMQKKIVFMQDL